MKSLLLEFVLIAVFAVILRRPAAAQWMLLRRSLILRGAKILALALLLTFAISSAAPVLTQRIAFHDEMTVLTTAAAWVHDQPMYPVLHGPEEYGLLYGPLTFLVYAPLAAFHVETLGVYQAWSILALLTSCLLLWHALRRITQNATTALLGLAIYITVLGYSTENVWADKGDSWILFFQCLGLWAVQTRTRTAVFVVAIAGACMADIKLTTLPFAFLPCLLLMEKHNKRLAWASGAGIVAFLLAPFLLPRIALNNYRAQLQLAAHHGLSSRLLQLNAHYLLLYLPLIALTVWVAYRTETLHRWIQKSRYSLGLFIFALAVCFITGSKNGAGPQHLLPIIAPLLMLAGGMLVRLNEAEGEILVSWPVAAPVLAVFLVAVLSSFPSFAMAAKTRMHATAGQPQVSMGAVQRDLQRIATAHPHDILQMGYSDAAHYSMTFTRQILQVRGNPLVIDANVRNEADLEGLPMSAAVIDGLAACRITLWVIPRGGRPFSMNSAYFEEGTIQSPALFPLDFQRAFFEHAHQVPSDSPYFDLWACSPQREKPALGAQ